MKYHFVVKAKENIFARSPRKNSNRTYVRKDVNEESSHQVCWSTKVSSKNRHEQKQTEGNLQPKQREKPQFSHLTNAEAFLRTLVAEHLDATFVEWCELFGQKTGNWVSGRQCVAARQKVALNRKKKHGTLAQPRQKDPKN